MNLTSAQQMEALLARTIDGLRFGKSLDADRELNAYFDDLEHEVIMATESAIEHLCQKRDEKLGMLNQRRKLALDSAHSELSRRESELCQAVKQLSSLENELQKICKSFDSVERTREVLFDLTLEIKRTERTIKKHLFSKEPLKFVPNESFFQTADHIGIFELAQPVTKEPSGEKHSF